jgi:polyphosphate kinase
MLRPSYGLASGHSERFFDRELSWIAFNRRLLYEVANPTKPVLARLCHLAQTAATLDEYFMVRIPLLQGVHSSDAAIASPEKLQRVRTYLKVLMDRQLAHFAFNLQPSLAHHGVYLLNYGALNDIQKGHCHHRFEEEVAPVLMALITAPGDPTPDFSNLSLNLAVGLEYQGQSQLAWIKLPRVLPRMMVLSEGSEGHDWVAIPLEQVIAAHLPALFTDYQVRGCFPFRVTRSADLGTLDSETANLLEMIQESLQQRQQQGRAVRLEVCQSMPHWMRSHLRQHLQLSTADTYGLDGWLGLCDLHEVTRLPRPDLFEPVCQPVLPPSLLPETKPTMLSFLTVPRDPMADLLTTVADRDLLLHFPYHSFTATVETFVAQAAADPAVLTIKMTLYRTAVDAPIVRSLMAAAKAGKQIVVLVELTAPLDEAINIHWAKSLEKAGAHVVYGVVGFRTHTNLVLVVRREGNQLRQYAYIGTGDYLPDRPQPYEDLGLLTSRPDVVVDLNHLFNFLTGCSRQVAYQTLMVAPGQLKAQLKTLIRREANHARQGKPARLVAKLNLLADPDIIEALYAASQAGADIDLIVRGICCLRPGVAGLSDRIRVRSILGQHIEHSRILYCQNDSHPAVWMGTADWTPGGLNDRIEVMVPLASPDLVEALRQILEALLMDNQDSWELQANGQYVKYRPAQNTPSRSVHQHLMQTAQQQGRKVYE